MADSCCFVQFPHPGGSLTTKSAVSSSITSTATLAFLPSYSPSLEAAVRFTLSDSSAVSSSATPDTVTVCAWLQSPVVNVSTTPSAASSTWTERCTPIHSARRHPRSRSRRHLQQQRQPRPRRRQRQRQRRPGERPHHLHAHSRRRLLHRGQSSRVPRPTKHRQLLAHRHRGLLGRLSHAPSGSPNSLQKSDGASSRRRCRCPADRLAHPRPGRYVQSRIPRRMAVRTASSLVAESSLRRKLRMWLSTVWELIPSCRAI